jgi:predicted negative regulator of RcsB-dependent stress response
MLIEKHEEQIVDDLFRFWGRYKALLIGSFLTIFTAILVYSYSVQSFQHRLVAAADHYQTVIESLDREDYLSLERSLTILKENYADSPYAALATMLDVSQLIKKHEFSKAEVEIDWLIHSSALPFVKPLALYKKAELYYVKGNFKQSLELLEQLNEPSLNLMRDHLSAKNLAQLENTEKALALYTNLLNRADLDQAHRALLVAEYNYLALTHQL